MDTYDVIIVGAGPAGITAGIYAARKRMRFLVISKDIGGQTAWSGDVENYTGYQLVTGPELVAKFEEHMRQYGVPLKENEEVLDVSKKNQFFEVKTDKGLYTAQTVIIATGKQARSLGVPGEQEFKNKGLTYCATCDGPLFAGKDVAVIGGGNSGLDAALQMVRIARHVYLLHDKDKLSGDDIMQEKLRQYKNVSVLCNTKILEIVGGPMVKAIQLQVRQEQQTLAVQGVFVEIGLIPNSGCVAFAEKNVWGEIKVDAYNRTAIPGLFAAGDVTDVPEKQIIIAAGEGSKALLSAFKYLSQMR